MTSRRRPEVVDRTAGMARSYAGAGSLRIEHWPGDPTAALLVQNDHTAALPSDELRHAIAAVRSRGYRIVRTSALLDSAEPTITAAGFEIIDRLVLLSRPIDPGTIDTGTGRSGVAGSSMRLGRLRRRHHRAASDLDRAAFGDFWGCDRAGITAIGSATPTARGWYLAPGRGAPLCAYLIVGRGLDRRGYVQRLAVHPQWWRRGCASTLLERAQQWLVADGTDEVLVNTSVDNTAALALYHRCGFTPTGYTMVVGQLMLEPLDGGPR